MSKPKISAAYWRIKPDAYNSWALCKPLFREDGTLRTNKDGSPHYEPQRWYTSLGGALRAWYEMLLADACSDKANDVSDLIDAVEDVADRFVESRTAGVSAQVAHDHPSARVSGRMKGSVA